MKAVPDFIKTAKKQLSGIECEIGNLLDAVAKGLYSDELKGKIDNLQAKKSALKVRLEEAEHERRNFMLTQKQIRDFLAKYSRIKDMTPMEKKKAVNIFAERVVVCDDDITVHLCFNPDKTAYKKGRGTIINTDGSAVCDPLSSFGCDGGGEA